MKIRARCKRDFDARWDGGKRTLPVRLVGLHVTASEAPARNIASYFSTTATKASSHLALDADECYRLLPDGLIAYTMPPLNGVSINIEICAKGTESRNTWLGKTRSKINYWKMLNRAAYKTAAACKRHGLRRSYVRGADLANPSITGITEHAWVNEVFHQSTHQDPGPGFPEKRFLLLVRSYYRALKAR